MEYYITGAHAYNENGWDGLDIGPSVLDDLGKVMQLSAL